jgi:hypothetical protein
LTAEQISFIFATQPGIVYCSLPLAGKDVLHIVQRNQSVTSANRVGMITGDLQMIHLVAQPVGLYPCLHVDIGIGLFIRTVVWYD